MDQHSEPIMQRLDPNATQMWRTARAIGLVILLLLGAGAWFLVLRRLTFIPAAARVLILAVPILLQTLNLAIYPPIEYRQWAYLVTSDRIEIRKGIFFHSVQVIPISRIQHVTVSEGPLARLYRLAAVTIHTAGGSFRIEGLARSTADIICDRLKDVVNRKQAGV